MIPTKKIPKVECRGSLKLLMNEKLLTSFEYNFNKHLRGTYFHDISNTSCEMYSYVSCTFLKLNYIIIVLSMFFVERKKI